jgi:hypothetical protein
MRTMWMGTALALVMALVPGCDSSNGGSDVASDLADVPAGDPGTDDSAADLPGDLPADTPPADVPPEDVPPEDVPPVDVPPTDVPPTDVPEDPGTPDTPADVPVALLTCLDLTECLVACPDEACGNNCFAAASPQAVSDRKAFEDCIDTECPQCGTPTECAPCWNTALAGACKALGELCLSEPTGTDPCATVLACVKGCSDVACGNACADTARSDARVLFDALGQCVGGQCPDLQGPMWTPCVETATAGACKTQVDACAAQTT